MSLKDQIHAIVERIDDEGMLKHILNIVNEIYILYTSGRWGR